ncbi:UNVERIFIED_CONTAM: hypothetical protein GTU68_022627 [Idotea baltica]|nr:hypothetical protein [Idotea baltica]
MSCVCITGGAGFIGSHIASVFKSQGDEVVVIDDLSSGSKENLESGIKLYELDIRSEECQKVLKEIKPDILIHTAAQVSVSKSMNNPKFDADVNIMGLLNILNAFDSESLPYLVFISTGGAMYGEQEEFPATEEHPAFPTSFYGLSKKVSELYLELWHNTFGLNYATLRLANVYGPKQNPHGEAGVVAIFYDKLLQGEEAVIYGDGEQTRDYVYVEDVASAVNAAVKSNANGIFNIGTSIETSVNHLYSLVTDILGSSKKANMAPQRAGEQRRSAISASKAKEILNWEPKKDVEQGLKETAEWFKSKHTH